MELKKSALNYFNSAKNFFENLNPIVATLILILVISVPITIGLSSKNQGPKQALKQEMLDSAKNQSLFKLGYDWVIKVPIKEEFRFRAPIAAITLFRDIGFFKSFIILENPIIYLAIILPGLIWSEAHVVPFAVLVESALLGLLVFRIGGIKGWLAGLLVHIIMNFASFIGFNIHILIK